MSANKDEQAVIDNEELMEAELFELAAREVNWHLSPGETDWKNAVIVQAARRVLVEGRRTTLVAEAAGISQAWLSQAIGRVREQLEVICARENWLCKMVVLPPETMALVQHLQHKTIDPLKRLQVEAIAKKRARKIKAAKTTGTTANPKADIKEKVKEKTKENGKGNARPTVKIVAKTGSGKSSAKTSKSSANKLKTKFD